MEGLQEISGENKAALTSLVKLPGSKLLARMARDKSKNERHGDSGRAMAKAAKQIAEYRKKLETAVGKEARQIEQRIKNVIRDAQKKDKGEEHSRRSKK